MPTVNTTDSAADPVRVLAERVHALRVSTGHSQRRFAKQIFCSHTTVNRAENGHWPISWHAMQVIITGCGIPTTDLPTWRNLWEQARDHASARAAFERLEASTPRMKSDSGSGAKGGDVDMRVGRTMMRLKRSQTYSPAYRAGLYSPIPNMRNVREYVHALQLLRASVNNPSWRELADRSGCSRNTLHDLFRQGRVELKWDVVEAFLFGCELSDYEIEVWRSIFRRLRVPSRPKPFRRSDPHRRPPQVDLTPVTSVSQYIDTLRQLNAVSKRSIDEVIRTASIHPGARIWCRSALFARFRSAATTGMLPEREVVAAYLRGCYCDTLGLKCAPDCNADLIEPWLRLYDELHQRYLKEEMRRDYGWE